MLGNTGVDRKTLVWIKEGVDDTLQFMQTALDEFTANSEDTTPIKTCIGALHRIEGVMQLVEIKGAKMLSAELELLACALVEEKVKHKIEAAEVLAAGMYQLTGYLESLYHGQADLPLILLPILNDCRACREAELFSEGDFFSPLLSSTVSLADAGQCSIAGDVSMVAKKMRPGYLSGLLGIIKQDHESENLEKLIFVLENLLGASITEEAKRFWWIASGVVDLLQAGDLKPSIAIKMLLGRIDRQIHRVIKNGESTFNEDLAEKVSKNLLFYIAQSPACNERVGQIQAAFRLGDTSMADIDKARESLYGFNVNMIDSVTTQLNEELLTIKDGLDIARRSGTSGSEELASLLKNFSMVADILNMLGMGKQMALMNQQREFLADKVSRNETLVDDDLMGIATALLQVESAIAHLASAIHYADDDQDGIAPAEYEALLKIVAKELLDIMRSIKEAVDHYALEGPSSLAVLADTPDLLKQMANVMRTINDEQQASLADAINQFVCQELILNEEGVSGERLDLLADAITGLENYCQAVLEESVAPELGLQVAIASMAKLGFPLEQGSSQFGAYSDVA